MDDFTIRIDANLDDKVAMMAVVGDTAMLAAEKIAVQARNTAPTGDTGDYRAGISAQATKNGARVLASDYKSAWIEFGVPGHLVFGEDQAPLPATFNLRKAAASLGYKFKKRR